MNKEGKANTVWGHDYASGLTHSLRRGARWVTSNPCKIQLFKKDFPDYYQELIAEIKRENAGATPAVMAAQMFTKVCAISARALYPIFKATNKQYGFVCVQVNPRDIKDADAMIKQVEFWYDAMKKELGVEEPNVVFKLPAVEAALEAARILLEKNYKLCMTMNITVPQHLRFAEILSKGKKNGYLVLMGDQLDDQIAKELEAKGVENAKDIAKHGAEAVIRKSYRLLAEKGYKPTIFEKNERAGGMLVYGIPSFKLEKDVVQAEIDIIKEMGVEIRTGVEVGKDITLDELRAQGYKAFYIAIGCQGGRLPGIPNDTAKGCSSAVDLLKEVNANEKYDIKGDVVVIGGGNVAIDVARDSKRCGSDMVKVNMFCLESRETMPASVEEIEEAESEGIVVNPGWGPKEVLVDENGEVRGIVLKKCLSVKDADGRFNPQYDENQLLTVECKHVFFSVGQAIVWGDLLKGSKVELGRGNGAVADALTYQTAEPDIFVGGDVYTGPKFAIDAIAAGKQGAISIHRFVQPHSSLTIGRNRNDFIELNKNDIKVENYDNSSRQIPGHNDSIDTKHSFRDAKLVFTEEQVKAETARCLGCGASVVDQNKCIGCGICTTKCEFDAIKLHRELPGCSKMVPSEDKLKYILPNGAKQAIKIKFSKKK